MFGSITSVWLGTGGATIAASTAPSRKDGRLALRPLPSSSSSSSSSSLLLLRLIGIAPAVAVAVAVLSVVVAGRAASNSRVYWWARPMSSRRYFSVVAGVRKLARARKLAT